MNPTTKPLDHFAALEELAFHWQRKPLLHRIYRDYYELIATQLRRDLPGQIVEIGSGLGSMKSVIPDCVCTETFTLPGIDRIENAYALKFEDETVSNLILFDVWHHLRFPGTVLKEFRRVLVPGGRLVLFEPAVSLLGLLVYGLFHHERLNLRQPIEPFGPGPESPDYLTAREAYYSAQSTATRMFCSSRYDYILEGWNKVLVRRMAGIAYVASGGFRGPQLYPSSCYNLVKCVTKPLDLLPAIFATRMLIVLAKKNRP